MPAERFRFAAAVYGVLVDSNRVLLLRRAGSGYHDGELSLPAGHLDGDEDAVGGLLRELREELMINAERDSCRLAVVLHRAPETAGDHEYLDLVFTVGRWAGTPSIGEPDNAASWSGPTSAVCRLISSTTSKPPSKRCVLGILWCCTDGVSWTDGR